MSFYGFSNMRPTTYEDFYIKELEHAIRNHCCYSIVPVEVIIKRAKQKAKESYANQGWSNSMGAISSR